MNRFFPVRLLLTLSSLACAGCGEPVDSEGEPHESQAAAFEMLQAVDANVTLDSEGMIFEVEFESDDQGDELFDLLKGVPTLKRLSLIGSAVTDSGLEHVREMQGLEYLYLEETRVSGAAVRKLRQDLPNCRIDYGDEE